MEKSTQPPQGLLKLTKYIHFHMIKLKDLWTRPEVQVHQNIFFQMIEDIGYKLKK